MPRPLLRPQTRPAKSSELAGVSFVASPAIDNSCQLFAGGGDTPLSKSDRADLLSKVRAGEVAELELEAVTFIQRETANRNFVRFKPGILAAFAKSFEGQPFLADHNAYELAARGGTITKSVLEHVDEGGAKTKQIRMRLKLVKPWAVEGALDGTLDRFSIGWARTAPVICSICELAFFGTKCSHWPGEKDENGAVCEALFTGADGTEVSGVNVPAVVGTRVESISQLEAIDPGSLAYILGDDTTGSAVKAHDEDPNMNKLKMIAASLGLPEDATEDQILEASQRNADELTLARAAKKTQEERLAALETERVEREKTARLAAVEAGVSRLISLGKIKPGGPSELALRRIGTSSLDMFDAHVKELAAGENVTPVGLPTPGATPDPVLGRPSDGKAFIGATPGLSTWLRNAGISEEDFETHGAHAREVIEHTRAQR